MTDLFIMLEGLVTFEGPPKFLNFPNYLNAISPRCNINLKLKKYFFAHQLFSA